MAAPRVSVVIPAYNAAGWVRRAADSVLAQTWTDFELLVVDDGSTDDTGRVLLGYGSAVRVIGKPNGGLSSARNAGVAEARGELVAFLDADDWWLPTKLEMQMRVMSSRPEVGFCSTVATVVDPDGRVLNVWHAPRWSGSFLAHLFSAPGCVAGSGSAVVVRRSLFAATGPFDETLPSLEDVDMWMRLAAVTGYACVDEPLTTILKRPESMSRNLEVMRSSAIRVLHKNRHLLPLDLRGSYWRTCLAGTHADYAKWRYRDGQRGAAIREVMRMLTLAPRQRGRLAVGLLVAMLLGQSL